MRILAMEEFRMISFSWNAPPSIPEIRSQRTFVNIHFSTISETKTRILFRNVGYGQGGEWKKALRYFEGAWGNVVLPRFRYYLENGRYDWDDPPDLSSYQLHDVSR
jgi:hypothetical protein